MNTPNALGPLSTGSTASTMLVAVSITETGVVTCVRDIDFVAVRGDRYVDGVVADRDRQTTTV
jgi:hypothetical protein